MILLVYLFIWGQDRIFQGRQGRIFVLQQPAFTRNFRASGTARVATDTADSHHPVTGDNNGNRVAPAGIADSTRTAAETGRKLAIGEGDP